MTQTILAIECSSELCSVSLSFNDQLTFKEELAPREHAYLTLPFAQALLQESGLGFDDLTGIAFGQGPGAFTGLRVAASIAQGLALAHDLPLYSACSLSALALQAKNICYDQEAGESLLLKEGSNIVSVLDARMSELYWSLHQVKNGELVELLAPKLSSAEGLVSQLSEPVNGPCYFIGPGCRYLKAYLSQGTCKNFSHLDSFSERFPHSREIINLLSKQLISTSNTFHQSSEIPMPIYLRNNVAAKSQKPMVP